MNETIRQALLPGIALDGEERDAAFSVRPISPMEVAPTVPGAHPALSTGEEAGPPLRNDQHLLPGFTLVALLDMTADAASDATVDATCSAAPAVERGGPASPCCPGNSPDGEKNTDMPDKDEPIGAPMHVFAPDRAAPPLPPIAVIGLGLGQALPPKAARALRHADVLALPKRLLGRFRRHRALVVPLAAPLEPALLALEDHRRQGRRCVVLADGDPLLYGIGATLARRLVRPGQNRERLNALDIQPGISAMQTLCARLALPWHDVETVSLHGREAWLPLAHAVLGGRPVCVYTDSRHPPDAIARFLLERGVDWYRMAVGARLESRRETVAELPLYEAAGRDFSGGETVLLLPAAPPRGPRLGLDESALVVEAGLYTKAPVRAAALSLLNIAPDATVWDVGAGSGCVALEAAALASRGSVHAVEQHPDRVLCIQENRRRLGVPHLEIITAAAPLGLDALPDPDAVFLGGGLGGGPGGRQAVPDPDRLTALLAARSGTAPDYQAAHARAALLLNTLLDRLRPGGTLVAACTLLSSLHILTQHLTAHGLPHAVTEVQASVSAPLAGSLTLKAHNPIFLVQARKPAA